MSAFGIYSKWFFLQDLFSGFISRLNPAIVHNVEKYYALMKVHYLSAIEEIEGDYLEFGVYTGSSFSHSMRCCHRLTKYNQSILRTRFFGFDSFEGFGKLDDDDVHSFYTDQNFETSYSEVQKRVQRAAGKLQFKLIKGYFSDTLNVAPQDMGIEKSRIVFIDSDTYSSSKEAFSFVATTVQLGTIFVLDDYFSYKGNSNRGVARAFVEFCLTNKFEVRQILTYGMGGVVFVISNYLE